MVRKYQAEANNKPGGQQMPGAPPQMPEHLIIGTKKAFANNYAFPYQKKQKGSQWARTGEVLVLRCENETWTAFDSAVSADGTTLQCRQPVSRCLATDITQRGWRE